MKLKDIIGSMASKFAALALALVCAGTAWGDLAVAKVGNTEYGTIGEAIAAWGPGKTLTLLDNVKCDQTVIVEVNATKSTQNWTLDLGDYTWTADGCNAFQLYAAGGTVMAQNYGLKVYANENGGITAADKYCIECKYDDSTAGYRPRLEIHGGTYTGSYIIYYASLMWNNTSVSNGPSTWFYKGNDGKDPVFNGNFALAKCPVNINAGVFNGTTFNTYPVSSTANTGVNAGKFKALPSNSNNKATTYASGRVFVADTEGYYDFVSTVPETYTAYTSKLSGNPMSPYTGGIYWESADDAIAKIGSLATKKVTLSAGVTATQPLSISSGTYTIDATAEGAAYDGQVTLRGTSAKFVLEGEGGAVVTDRSGYVVTQEISGDTYTYSIFSESQAAAKIGDYYYQTLDAAVAVYQDSDTIYVINYQEGVTVAPEGWTFKAAGDDMTLVKAVAKTSDANYSTADEAIATIEDNKEITVNVSTSIGSEAAPAGSTVTTTTGTAVTAGTGSTAETTVTPKTVTISTGTGSEATVKTVEAYVVSQGSGDNKKFSVVTDVSKDETIVSTGKTVVSDFVKPAAVIANAVASENLAADKVSSMVLSLAKTETESSEPGLDTALVTAIDAADKAFEVHPVATITTTTEEGTTATTSYAVANSELAEDASFTFTLDFGVENAGKFVTLTHYAKDGTVKKHNGKDSWTETLDANGIATVTLTEFSYLLGTVSEEPPATYVAQIGDDKYETLAEALADVTKDTPLTWVSEDAWPVATPVYYNGNFYAVEGTTQNGGGALDHAIAQANTDHASSTDVALIYVRPGYTQTAGNEGAGTFLATYNKHQPFASNIIIYGNNASLGGEAWEPSVTGMTRDMSVAIYNLHDGAGIWGQHNKPYVLTATMENCNNVHEYMVNGSAGSAESIANVTIKNCTFGTRNNVVVASTNPGTVVIDGCTFTENNNNYVVNINNKNGGTTTANISNSSFTGGGNASKGIVRVNGEVEGTTMSGTFENLTFNNTSSAVADIQIGHASEAADNKANVSYTVSGTTGVLKVFETGSTTLKNDGETAIVAANNYSGNNKTYVAQIGETKYTSLAAAVEAVPENGAEATTITMIANEELDATVTIPANKNVVLDLNGKTISADGFADKVNVIVNKGTLTVQNGTIEVSNAVKKTYAILSNGDIIVNAVTINSNSGGIRVQGSDGVSPAGTIIDCAITVNTTANTTAHGVYASDGANVVIKSGTYSYTGPNEQDTVQACDADTVLTIEGGTFTATLDSESTQNATPKVLHNNGSGAVVYVTGGTFTGDLGADAATYVSGGTFNITQPYTSAIEISGGYFSFEVTQSMCAADYMPAAEQVEIGGTMYYTVETLGVAKIERDGEEAQYFSTLAAASGAAVAGDVITILQSTDEELPYPTAENVTITSLEGVVLTGGSKGGYAYVGFTLDGLTFREKGFAVNVSTTAGQTATVTIRNCTFDECLAVAHKQGAVAVTKSGSGISNVVFENNTITDVAGQTDNTVDARIDPNNPLSLGVYFVASGDVTVTGNTISGVTETGINVSTPGAITIADNNISNWGSSGEGRAIRIAHNSGKAKVAVTGNVMQDAKSTENYAKITGVTAAEELDVSGNYWGGLDPASDKTGGTGDPVYETDASGDVRDQLRNYYTALTASGALDANSYTEYTFVAQIGTTKYETLAEAIAAADTASEDEISILDDSITTSPDPAWYIYGTTLKRDTGRDLWYVAGAKKTTYGTYAEALNAASDDATKVFCLWSGYSKTVAEAIAAGSLVIEKHDRYEIEGYTGETAGFVHVKDARGLASLTDFQDYCLANCRHGGSDGRDSYDAFYWSDSWTVVLDCNIDLDNKAWTAVNMSSLVAKSPMVAKVDGNGKTILNLSVNVASGYAGLFTGCGLVSNLKVDGANISAGTAGTAGTVVAFQRAGGVENVVVENATVSGKYVGGLAGVTYGTLFESNVLKNVSVETSVKYVGGISGQFQIENESDAEIMIRDNVLSDIKIRYSTEEEIYGSILGAWINSANKQHSAINNTADTVYTNGVLAVRVDGDESEEYNNLWSPRRTPTENDHITYVNNVLTPMGKTVTFEGEAPTGATGDFSLPASTAYAVGSALPLPTYTATDASFAGWQVKDSAPAVIVAVVPADAASPITLVATWTGAKMIQINAGGTEPTTIKVTDEWLEANGLADEEDTDVIRAALEKPADNGVPTWENYVLGQSIDAAVSSGAEQGETTLMPVTSTIDVPAVDTGFDVKYRLDTVDASGKVVAQGTAQATPDLALELSGVASSAYYRLAAVVTAKDGSGASVSVQATNTIGVLAVNSSAKRMIVAVPWASLDDGRQISVSNLVRTATLSEGDELKVYDPSTGTYKVWTLNSSKEWEPNTTVTESGSSQAPSAYGYSVPRGAGVWLTRTDTTQPIYLVGEVAEQSTTTTIAGAQDDEPTWNLVAAPTVEAVNLNVKFPNANEGDVVLVPTDGAPMRYTYKGDSWGYDDYVTTVNKRGIEVVKVVRKTDVTNVPIGTGFWYMNAGDAKNVEW